MTNVASCPLKLIGFFCAAMLMAAPVFAQTNPIETFFLIPSEGAEATAHLHDQGYALKGSRLRLGIRADQPSKINLSYLNPAGNETELLQDVELAPGTFLLVPSEEDWFTLDGEPGPYNFVLETDSGHTVSQTVNLLPAAAPPLPADLRPALEIAKYRYRGLCLCILRETFVAQETSRATRSLHQGISVCAASALNFTRNPHLALL